MAKELTCPTHGPYPASLVNCPVCAKGQAPRSLNAPEDDMPTNIGGGFRSAGRGSSYNSDDDSPTVLPAGRKVNNRLLDDDGPTIIPGRSAGDDRTQLDVEETGPQAILWVKDGRRKGKIYPIPVNRDTVIGRKNVNLVIDEDIVSEIHAKIVFENDHFIIVDFRSKNGTFVNGERIRAETILKENDVIKIGHMTFVMKILE